MHNGSDWGSLLYFSYGEGINEMDMATLFGSQRNSAFSRTIHDPRSPMDMGAKDFILLFHLFVYILPI